MKCDNETFTLYAVTDRKWLRGRTLYRQAEEALQGGVTCLQLREKQLEEPAFLAEAMELSRLCRARGVPLIINDNVEIARESGAAGVHLGQEDDAPAAVRGILGPDAIIGVTVHSVEEAVRAERDGADYLGAGAVFQTGTKANARALSHAELRRICDAVSIPVVAIGGISEDNILRLAGSGIAGVAVVSAIFAAGDIPAAAGRLLQLSRQLSKAEG